MSHVLIVDDESAICWALREALEEDGHHVDVAASAEAALRLTEGGRRPDAIVMDVRLPGIDGLEAMRRLRARLVDTPVVVVTAFGNLETAVRAMEAGAFDYLVKPFDLSQAIAVLERALDLAQGDAAQAVAPASAGAETLVGSSAAMQQVFKQIAQVAASEVSVLITGESGTGKELVARAIHRHSGSREGPFLPVCIPALNPGLIESELFGHVRGAFTGAAEDRAGLLELAAGGTVLLDEIADVPPGVQVKLLRALEQREVLPVGGVRPRPLRLRVLAATNRLLPELIAAGQFREDLYFRLGGFHIHLPPLRERREDVPNLASHFLREAGPQPGGRTLRLSDDALAELSRRDWPGNVRELRNALEHAAIVARGGEIRREHLPPPAPFAALAGASPAEHVRRQVAAWAAAAEFTADAAPGPDVYERFLQLVEPPLLEAVLKRCGQNRAAAAQLLGLHRATLRHKLRRHGLE